MMCLRRWVAIAVLLSCGTATMLVFVYHPSLDPADKAAIFAMAWAIVGALIMVVRAPPEK